MHNIVDKFPLVQNDRRRECQCPSRADITESAHVGDFYANLYLMLSLSTVSNNLIRSPECTLNLHPLLQFKILPTPKTPGSRSCVNKVGRFDRLGLKLISHLEDPPTHCHPYYPRTKPEIQRTRDESGPEFRQFTFTRNWTIHHERIGRKKRHVK